MIIKIRKSGLNPTSFDLEEVYKEIRERNTVDVASIGLLDRLLLGVAEGEIPYGTTLITAYTEYGEKVQSTVSNTGTLNNLQRVIEAAPFCYKKIPSEKAYTDEPNPICGNCSWNIGGLCLSDDSDRFNAYVTDFEEVCDDYIDCHEDYMSLVLDKNKEKEAQDG